MKSEAARFEHARAMAVGVDSLPHASVSKLTIESKNVGFHGTELLELLRCNY